MGGFLATYNGKVETKRMNLRLTDYEYERFNYWASEEGCSCSEFVVKLLDMWIDLKNGNYNLETLEVKRLNQLIEAMNVLADSQKSLENVVITGFDSLLSLTKGDDYLLDNNF